jgi:KipI family sensor histidine kinase inhibitor
LRFLPAGPNAVLIEVDDLDHVIALRAEVERRRSMGWAPGLIDAVAGARTLLLDGVSPGVVVDEVSSWSLLPTSNDAGLVIDIDCVYDGPDLEEVASQWGVTVRDAVAYHTSMPHSVAFCGFAPGFAYLDGLGADHHVARRPNPRTVIPAGSVALGGAFTGIYPRPSPGGWQLIGRTDALLWDPQRRPAALLAPGTRVRFVERGP